MESIDSLILVPTSWLWVDWWFVYNYHHCKISFKIKFNYFNIKNSIDIAFLLFLIVVWSNLITSLTHLINFLFMNYYDLKVGFIVDYEPKKMYLQCCVQFAWIVLIKKKIVYVVWSRIKFVIKFDFGCLNMKATSCYFVLSKIQLKYILTKISF